VKEEVNKEEQKKIWKETACWLVSESLLYTESTMACKRILCGGCKRDYAEAMGMV
jgi:hypothetical protein